MARQGSPGWMALAVLFAAGLLFGPPARPLHAQSRPRGTSYALLVGCSHYEAAEFPELPFTGNDVEQFRRALLATGFAADNVWVLHDDRPKTTDRPLKRYILEKLALILEGMRPEDTVVVALSGHGLQFKGDPVSYFVPVDGKAADKKTLLPLGGKGGIYERLRACKAQKKLLLVNACRNDPTASLDFAANRLELVDEDRPEEVPEGIAAIYSCSAGQKSYYDPKRKLALFFDHAVRAWKGEYSPGEPVTLEMFLEQVRVRTKTDAIRTLNRPQVPYVVREFKGEWVITRAEPPRADAELAAGLQLLRDRKLTEAVLRLRQAVALAPADGRARTALAAALRQQGEYAEALAALRDAVARDPRHAPAVRELGVMHYFGYGVMPPDHAGALKYFRQAAAAGDAEAMAWLGRLVGEGRGTAPDAAEGVRWLRQAVERGEPLAMVWLADRYRDGYGVNVDPAEARRLYERALPLLRAAAPDRPRLFAEIGDLYGDGRGTAKDPAAARTWYTRGAQRNEPEAMAAMGVVFESGLGVNTDYAEALKWYQKASALGAPLGVTSLGVLHELGQGVRKDEAQAAKLYQRAAELGEAEAMARLAGLYADGAGVTRNDGQAFQWYQKAAERGHVPAMVSLGLLYQNGAGVSKNATEAAKWYRKAAERGNADGMNWLAALYAHGLGVPKVDFGEAMRWYRKAADLGHAQAMDNVGVMFENGNGVPKDAAEAAKWYRKAADLGEPEGMNDLAALYENGHGVVRDLPQAIQWYRRAAAKGHAGARDSLKRLGANP